MVAGTNMPTQLIKNLENTVSRQDVANRSRGYVGRFSPEEREKLKDGTYDYMGLTRDYYDLVTSFYEYGWGDSFHFAPLYRDKSFLESIRLHETYLADRLDIRPGMGVLDIGCGIGGPLVAIAQHTGAAIVGLNNNEAQVEKARAKAAAANLAQPADFIPCDYMRIDAPDGSFDRAYAIESMPHATSKAAAFAEVWRILKPGGLFASYDWCVTSKLNPANADHAFIKSEIMLGNALPDISLPREIDRTLEEAGFEILMNDDLAETIRTGVPWYKSLGAQKFTPAEFLKTPVGRRVTSGLLWLFERIGLAPKGAHHVATILNRGADGLTRGGQLDIFTPMYFTLARKP